MRISPIILLISLATPMLSRWAHAGETPNQKLPQSPKWTVQLDPLTMALGLWNLQVEYAFSDHHSIYLSPSIRLLDSPLNDEKYDAIGVETAYRYFWRGHAPQGPWLQGRLVGSYLTTETESTLGGYVSALAGYTWIFDTTYVLALGAGIQYLQMHVGDDGPEGVLPAAHTAFGLAF